MSKTRNTKQRSDELQAIAKTIVAQVEQSVYDSLSLAAAKPYRVAWQHQLMERTGCAPFTARAHIDKALRRQRHTPIEN